VKSFKNSVVRKEENYFHILIIGKNSKDCAKTRGPNLVYMYPQGYICLSEGLHLRLAIEEKNIFTYYLFPNIHIRPLILFYKNHCMLIFRYIYEYS